MSQDDSIPVGIYDDFESDDEREDFLVDSFCDITLYESERRMYHDTAAYFAHEVGSPECVALGHSPIAEFEDDPLYESGVHVMGWDSPVCNATAYGSACSYCEGECDHPDVTPNLWELVAIGGAKS